MSGRLAGKTALVTGAASGIGRAVAELFAAEGAVVLAIDRDGAALAGLDGCVVRQCDLLEPGTIEAIIAEASPLGILFNCAGIVAGGTILDCSDADWDASFALNVTAMFRAIRAALPAMLVNGGGSIINMASVCSSIKGLPNRFLYGASKAAVIGMTKSFGKDLATSGVLVNAVAPAVIATPMLSQMSQEHIDYMVERIPMGRLGQPEEVAELIAFLASERMSFSTGATFDISGGRATF